MIPKFSALLPLFAIFIMTNLGIPKEHKWVMNRVSLVATMTYVGIMIQLEKLRRDADKDRSNRPRSD